MVSIGRRSNARCATSPSITWPNGSTTRPTSIVPLIRGGRVDFEGAFHAARDLPQAPRGPRPGGSPLLIGGNGPKGQRHAVRHADVWSGYVEERADVEEIAPRIASLEAICAEEGREPASIGRSIGVLVNPFLPADQRPNVISGTPEEIAQRLRTFRDVGYTQAEIMFNPGTIEALEALAPVVDLVAAG